MRGNDGRYSRSDTLYDPTRVVLSGRQRGPRRAICRPHSSREGDADGVRVALPFVSTAMSGISSEGEVSVSAWVSWRCGGEYLRFGLGIDIVGRDVGMRTNEMLVIVVDSALKSDSRYKTTRWVSKSAMGERRMIYALEGTLRFLPLFLSNQSCRCE